MGEEIQWDRDAMANVRSRGDRYPDGLDIEPEWAQEVMADVNLLALEPDPKSRMGSLAVHRPLPIRREGAGRDRLSRPRR